MTMILAKHKITGLIAKVSAGTLTASAYLTPATKADVDELKRSNEIRVFGAPTNGVVPETLTDPKPDKTWTKAELIAFAEGRKISVDESMTKADILAALGADEGE